MPKRRYTYDAQKAERLLGLIRVGVFPHVAAEAVEIPADVYRQWLRWGEGRGAREPFRGFAGAVRTAAAQCRALAEKAVYDHDPKFWLKYGPGRDLPGHPGWAGEMKPLLPEDPEAGDWLSTPEARALLSRLLNALVDFPEAKMAVASALRQK